MERWEHNLHKTQEELLKFIPKKAQFIRSEDKNDLFEGVNYEIYEEGTEEILASCVCNESGGLINYYYLAEYETGSMTSYDVEVIGNDFIQSFYPKGLDTYTLDSIIDLDDEYMVNYGIRDEKIGVIIPHVGFTLTVSTTGQVVQFSYVHEEYDIVYPDQIISAEEAKDRYILELDFQLIIHHIDSEIYVNGDDTDQLVYQVIESAMDIPASGQDPMPVREFVETTAIKYQDVPYKTVYDMVGLNEEYLQVGEEIHGDERIELWAHYSSQLSAGIDYLDEYCEKVIRIVFHKDNHQLLFVHNGEIWSESERTEQLEEDVLEQSALDLMFLLFPDTHERFTLEVLDLDESPLEEDQEIYDMDEELCEYELEEDSRPFYFHAVLDGIPIDDKVICIQVGVYTGKITSVFMETINNGPMNHIQTKPEISKDEAKQLYANDVEMELIFGMEYDEDGKGQIHLSYMPSFPKTIGHVRLIDAQTGKGYYVDVGDSLFF